MENPFKTGWGETRFSAFCLSDIEFIRWPMMEPFIVLSTYQNDQG